MPLSVFLRQSPDTQLFCVAQLVPVGSVPCGVAHIERFRSPGVSLTHRHVFPAPQSLTRAQPGAQACTIDEPPAYMSTQISPVTAAQSAFAVAVLSNRKISVREAGILLGVWLAQLVTKLPLFEAIHGPARISIGILYLVMAVVVIWRNRTAFRPLLYDGLMVPVAELAD